jgi:GLPGLI family protein
MFKIKLTLLLFSFLFLQNSVFSQNAVKISGCVKYSVIYAGKSINPKPTISNLYFSNNESVDINKRETVNDGNIQKKDNGFQLTLPYGDSLGDQVYRNISNNTIITRTPKNAISEAFIVNEKWTEITWEISKKTKKIGNYNATLATGSFRGRVYKAWFTYEIPTPFGPWKLHGLPGLILEAEDAEKLVTFNLLEIKIPYDTSLFLNIPTADIILTHKEEVYRNDNFHILLAKKMNSRARKGTKVTPVPNNDGRKYKREKTYEWEKEE